MRDYQKEGVLLRVRPLEIRDQKAIFDLIECVNDRDDLDYSLTEEWFAHIIGEKGHGLFVAECQGDSGYFVCGLGTCMVDYAGGQIADILLLVHPERRGSGVEAALYEKISQFCTEHRVAQAQVAVRRRLTDARQFWIDRAFSPAIYSWKLEMKLADSNEKDGLGKSQLINYHVREAVVGDFAIYRQLMEECFAHTVEYEHFTQSFADPSLLLFFLEEQLSDGRPVVGMISIQIRQSLKMAYLFDIAIIEEKRGQGIGSAMITEMLGRLRNMEMERVALIVDGENRNAISLYEKLGFQETDEEILMEKRL